MWEFFLHSSNLAFSISLCLMVFIGVLEILLLVSGSSCQGFFDQFFPTDFTTSQPDFNLEHSGSWIGHCLAWLYLGRIPVLIWIIVFLSTFSIFGFIFQYLYVSIFSHFLSIWIIAPLTLLLCMPLVRLNSAFISKIIPKDETTAVYSEELVGLIAEIILGEAKPNYPAQAKLKDRFNQTHYVLVEPETNTIFKTGDKVVLTQKTHQGFKAIFK